MSTGTKGGTMSEAGTTTRGWARARRRLGILTAVLAVGLPIPLGLVLAWQAHPLLVVPAYLLGIPAWLSLVCGAWSLVRRLLPASEPVAEVVEVVEVRATGADSVITTELRLPAPRVEGAPLRTPTP
jgi:hypothetical protein